MCIETEAFDFPNITQNNNGSIESCSIDDTEVLQVM